MKNTISLLFALTISGFYLSIAAQELKISQESSIELTKVAAKEGRYAGTFLKGDQINVVYAVSSKNEGVQIEEYNFDNSLNYKEVSDKFVEENDASKEFVWYMTKTKVEEASPTGQKFLTAGAAFGSGMKILLGTIKKKYYLGYYTGMEFVEEKALKPKTGEIWRIQPSGYKTTSKIDALSTTNGFYNDLAKYGNPLVASADAPLLAAGVITEKIKMKGPWLYSSNRVAIIAIDGNNFDASKYNIYPLPYTAQTMGAGLGQDDNLSVLFAPLNGPTNVKELKHYLWKDRKNNFTLMRFNDNYELVDSVSFLSELMWGKFQILNGHGSTIIAGYGKSDFDGWARNANQIGLKSIDGIQITNIKDGKTIYSKLFSEAQLKSKLVTPSGSKSKYGLALSKNTFKEAIMLPNGDAFMFGQSNSESYALQISSTGELLAYYRFPRISEKTAAMYNYNIVVKGNDLFLVLNEQPVEFDNDAHFDNSKTEYVSIIGDVKLTTTTTTTTVTKLNEVFLVSKLIKINTSTQQMSNAIIIDGKDYYTMGSFPAMFTKDAVYFTCRDKGPKGKTLSVIKIDI